MTEETVIQFLFMKTKSHAKLHLWLKACASRFPKSKGNFPWLQLHLQTAPDPGHLEGPSSPPQKRDNSCFHYCLQLSFLDIELCISKDLFPKWENSSWTCLQKNVTWLGHAGNKTVQTHLFMAQISQFKIFKIYLIKIGLNFIIYNPRKIKKLILKTEKSLFWYFCFSI